MNAQVKPLDILTASRGSRLHNGDVIPVSQEPWPYFSSYVRAMYPVELLTETKIRILEFKAAFFDYFSTPIETRRLTWRISPDGLPIAKH